MRHFCLFTFSRSRKCFSCPICCSTVKRLSGSNLNCAHFTKQYSSFSWKYVFTELLHTVLNGLQLILSVLTFQLHYAMYAPHKSQVCCEWPVIKQKIHVSALLGELPNFSACGGDVHWFLIYWDGHCGFTLRRLGVKKQYSSYKMTLKWTFNRRW